MKTQRMTKLAILNSFTPLFLRELVYLLEPLLRKLNLLLELLWSHFINLLGLFQVLLVCLHLRLVIGVIYLSLIAIQLVALS